MALVEGIAVSGEYVSGLDNKRFVIASPPSYEDIVDMADPSKKIRRLKITVLMHHDRSVLDYYPNKTSVKTITELYGFEMDKWVGMACEWEILSQKVGKDTKKVLYVKNVKIDLSKE